MMVQHNLCFSPRRLYGYQPQREERRAPQSRMSVLKMPDGRALELARFGRLRSSAKPRLGGAFDTCADRVKSAVPRAEYNRVVREMMRIDRRKRQSEEQRNILIGTLLVYAAEQHGVSPQVVLARIEREKTLAGTLLP